MTDAVDINIVLNQTFRQRTIQAPGTWIDPAGSVVAFYEKRKRPASVNGGKRNAGWRPPKEFFHYGCTTKSRPSVKITMLDQPHGKSGWIYENTGTSTPGQRTSVAHSSNVARRAEVKALLKLKDQKFNTGVFIGEGRDTVRLIGSAASGVANGIRNFKRNVGNFIFRKLISQRNVKSAMGNRRLSRGVRNAAEKWLQLQYGWRPLLNDVYGAIDACGDLFSYTRPRVTIKSSHSEISRRILSETSNITGSVKFDVRTVIKHGSHVRLDYELQLPNLQKSAQLGLTNPLEVAWELVPFSFVFDWFVPINQWLATLDADLGWSFIGGSRSDIARGEDTAAIPQVTNSPWVKISVSGRPAMFSTFNFSRAVYLGSPAPAPYYRDPFSTERALNAIALLTTLFSRR